MKRVYTMTIAVLVGIISMFSFTAFAQGPHVQFYGLRTGSAAGN
jgi:hypothetical protein